MVLNDSTIDEHTLAMCSSPLKYWRSGQSTYPISTRYPMANMICSIWSRIVS